MSVLVPIVEGDGEVQAVPVLIRKYLTIKRRWDLQIARPKNAHGCGNLTKAGGLERFTELAFREPGCSGVLVLMDLDEEEDCPAQLASRFVERIRAHGARRPVAVVFARREYEAWFLASLPTIVNRNIAGAPALGPGTRFDGDVEGLRSVKAWLSRSFQGTRVYKETEDQAPMTDLMDFCVAATRSRSFRRFTKGMSDLLHAIDSGQSDVTPSR
jgi:hypothetical protein